MEVDPFSKPGKFWRGNLHSHSTRSDRVLDPDKVARRYQIVGYDFLAITDHFVGLYDCPLTNIQSSKNENFTTILSAELHTWAMENGEIWHLVAVGLPKNFMPPNPPYFQPRNKQETATEIARRARDGGAFVVISHPAWSQMSLADAAAIKAAHAVEVYNQDCYAGCDRGYGFHVYEQLLMMDRKLLLCATADAHFNEPDHLGGWAMVKAIENSQNAILTALKGGIILLFHGPKFSQSYLE